MIIVVLSWILWCAVCMCTAYVVYCVLSATYIKPTYTERDSIHRRYTQEDFDKFTRDMDSTFTYCTNLRVDAKVVRKCKYKRNSKDFK
jgi:phosphate/sulfate permease